MLWNEFVYPAIFVRTVAYPEIPAIFPLARDLVPIYIALPWYLINFAWIALSVRSVVRFDEACTNCKGGRSDLDKKY